MKGQQRYQFEIFVLAAIGGLITLSFASCAKDKSVGTPIRRPPIDTIVPPPAPSKTYLALGDSYTIGQSVQVDERFPHQTAALLRNKIIAIAQPQYIAVSGWTTGNLLNAITQQNPQPGYDAVSLLIGVNNQYQGRDTFEYRAQFTQLALKAIELTKNQRSRVFVLSIPDYSVTPFARGSDRTRISAEIDRFNLVNKSVSDSLGVTWIEITQGSREALNDPTLVATDGLHPSGKEYAKWAAKLAIEMEKVLK